MPAYINRPFAQNGDRSVPPDQDNSGFVNFTTGYTQDYEIDIASGDPLAKAVEREFQNGLFNLITDNMQFFQTHGFQTYFPVTVNAAGYSLNDIVVYNPDPTTAGTTWRIYRSRTDNNLNVPPASGGNNVGWEEITAPSVDRQFIPMPAGGDDLNVSAKKGIVNAASQNINNAPYTNSGTWEFTDIATTTAVNIPAEISGTKSSGILESLSYINPTEANRSYLIQRYTSNNSNRVFVRSRINSTWTNWNQMLTISDVQQQIPNVALATSSANTYTLTPYFSGLGVYTGLELLFSVPATNTGAAYISIGGTTYSFVGFDLFPLPSGALTQGALARVQFQASGVFALMYCMNAPQIGKDAIAANQLVTKRQLDALAARVLTIDNIYPAGMVHFFANAVNPNTQWPGTVWNKLPDKSYIKIDDADVVLQRRGIDSYPLTVANIPQHTHSVLLTSSSAGATTAATVATDLGTKTSSTSGAHTHTGSGTTSSSGAHTHTITGTVSSTDLGTKTTSSSGAHYHDSGWGEALYARYGYFDSTTNNVGSNSTDFDNRKFNTSTAGAHTHTVVMGAHNHAFSGSSASAGAHTHTYSFTTSSAGAHTHTVALGSHAHTFSISAHTHSISGNTGAYGTASVTPIPLTPTYVILRGWYRVS